MGGGSKKTPEPTKFVAPPINDAPPANPIPNFFGGGQGGQPRVNPFAAMAQMPQAQAQNPFAAMQQQGAMTPETIEALLRKIRGQG